MAKPATTTHIMPCGDFDQQIEVKQRKDGLYWSFEGLGEWNGPFATLEAVETNVAEFGDAA